MSIATLKTISAEIHQLNAEAGLALEVEQDLDKYHDVLRKKAEKILSLPDLAPAGPIRVALEYFASQAHKYLAEENMFGLGTLLIRQGSAREDPNELEKLIAEAEESSL